MTKKRDSRGRLRNYPEEYKEYHGKPKQKEERASRNAARKKVSDWYKAHGKKLSSKKDVDHKDGNPKNNSSGNLRTMDRGANRAKSNRDRAKK